MWVSFEKVRELVSNQSGVLFRNESILALKVQILHSSSVFETRGASNVALDQITNRRPRVRWMWAVNC